MIIKPWGFEIIAKSTFHPIARTARGSIKSEKHVLGMVVQRTRLARPFRPKRMCSSSAWLFFWANALFHCLPPKPLTCYKNWMVDSSENLVLAQLRAVRADISDVQGSLGEIERRLANLESGQASIIQYLGSLAAADAQQQLSIDGLNERLVRIERRLELRDA